MSGALTHIADLGPAMRALSEKQRIWVKTLIDQGTGGVGHGSKGYTNAVAEAYPDCKPELRHNMGYQLAHNEKVQDAIREEVMRRTKCGGLVEAHTAIMEIVGQRGDPNRLNAAKFLYSLNGINEVQEKRIVHQFEVGDPEVVAKAKVLAKRLGVPLEQLVGKRIALAQKPIDAEFVEVQDEFDPKELEEY